MTFTISDDVPLEDVLAEIRRVYDVDVQVVIHDSGAPDLPEGPDAPDTPRPSTHNQRNKQDRT